MREIKFRAWHKGLRKMMDVYTLCQAKINTEGYANRCEGWYGDNEQVVFKFDEAICLQFTGLTDKNGKEIYEGDILKESDNEIVFNVEYDTEKGGYFMPTSYDPEYIFTIGNIPTDVEVIGNIYESPHLLTTKK